ncbi:hypothetical protein JHK85_025230 [Glycine max]|nr:hypothetical protein JHK85_025230 [Glycine max]
MSHGKFATKHITKIVEKMRKQVHREARRPCRAEKLQLTRAAEGISLMHASLIGTVWSKLLHVFSFVTTWSDFPDLATLELLNHPRKEAPNQPKAQLLRAHIIAGISNGKKMPLLVVVSKSESDKGFEVARSVRKTSELPEARKIEVNMAYSQLQKVKANTYIKASIEQFYDVLCNRTHHVANIFPGKVQPVKIHKGEWGTEGSIISWNYLHNNTNCLHCLQESEKVVYEPKTKCQLVRENCALSVWSR